MRAQRFPLSCSQVMGRAYAILAGFGALVFLSLAMAVMLESGLLVYPALVAALGFVGWFLGMVTMPVHVTVGEDGLYAWYGLARYYVPIVNIEETIPPYGGTTSVGLTNGSTIRFHGETRDAQAMFRELRKVLALRNRGAAPESVFARDGRTFAEWARAARALVDESSSYRAAKAPRDLALAHATNDRLPHDVRIGAVLAIAPDATKDEKAALVRIIEGVASPTLQRVLVHATSGNLDEAEEAHELYEAERSQTKA